MSAPAPRQDLYTGIHKAIRVLLYDAARRLQRADFTSAAEAEAVLAHVAVVVDMLEEHGRHEERFIHEHLRAHEPQVVADFEEEHRALERVQAPLSARLQQAKAADGDARAAAFAALDRAFARWLGAQLQHMVHEEEVLLPATQRHFDDQRLAAMRTSIQLDMPPARYAEWLRWLMNGMSLPELTSLMAGVRAGTPSHVFGVMVTVAEAELGDRWPELKARLGA